MRWMAVYDQFDSEYVEPVVSHLKPNCCSPFNLLLVDVSLSPPTHRVTSPDVYVYLKVFVREPGGIGGQQFIVEECSECEVYLLDHTAALTIDLCTDCRIFAGPCESRYFRGNVTLISNKRATVQRDTYCELCVRRPQKDAVRPNR